LPGIAKILRILLFAGLMQSCALGFAAADAADHARFVSRLIDAKALQSVRERLGSSWQILGNPAPEWNIQANLIGRTLAGAAKGCGLKIKWDAVGGVERYVWPVVVNTPVEIERTLEGLWTYTGKVPPPYLKAAAAAAYEHLALWDISLLAVNNDVARAEEVNFVFLDGRQVDRNNDLAVIDYAIASTIAGISMPDGSDIDADYSFLQSGGTLSNLTSSNNDRFENLCRIVPIVRTICESPIESATPETVSHLLSAIDEKCTPDGEVVGLLRKMESDLRNGN
jgi:hypothetical protein